MNKETSFNIGCLPLILTILFLWALCFGVNWNGKQHGISCSCDKGVVIQ